MNRAAPHRFIPLGARRAERVASDDRDWRVSIQDLIALRERALPLAHPPRARAPTGTAGARHLARARGQDYRESRHYQSGDDIRNMDWRVTARAGQPHIKLFDEERARPVAIVADFGAGMFFASRGAFKSVLVARLAALIGWSAIAHGDRVGGLLFGATHHELPPLAGRHGQLRLIRTLAQFGDPDLGRQLLPDPSALGTALGRLRRVLRPGSLVFVLSDFSALEADVVARHLRQIVRHNQLIALAILDYLEQQPPPPGRYGVTDGQRASLLDSRDAQARAQYRARAERQHNVIREITAAQGVPLVVANTDSDPVAALAQALAARAVPQTTLFAQSARAAMPAAGLPA